MAVRVATRRKLSDLVKWEEKSLTTLEALALFLEGARIGETWIPGLGFPQSLRDESIWRAIGKLLRDQFVPPPVDFVI